MGKQNTLQRKEECPTALVTPPWGENDLLYRKKQAFGTLSTVYKGRHGNKQKESGWGNPRKEKNTATETIKVLPKLKHFERGHPHELPHDI